MILNGKELCGNKCLYLYSILAVTMFFCLTEITVNSVITVRLKFIKR